MEIVENELPSERGNTGGAPEQNTGNERPEEAVRVDRAGRRHMMAVTILVAMVTGLVAGVVLEGEYELYRQDDDDENENESGNRIDYIENIGYDS